MTSPLDNEFTLADKEWHPIWCESCNQLGFVFVDESNPAYLVVCKTCGAEYSEVWCPNCEMGGDFVRKLAKRPTFWVCKQCKNKYPLPEHFYTQPVSLHLEKTLPASISDRIKNSGKPKPPLTPKRLFVLAIYITMLPLMVIGALFLPSALVAGIFAISGWAKNGQEIIIIMVFLAWLPIWVALLPKLQHALERPLNQWAAWLLADEATGQDSEIMK